MVENLWLIWVLKTNSKSVWNSGILIILCKKRTRSAKEHISVVTASFGSADQANALQSGLDRGAAFVSGKDTLTRRGNSTL